MVTVTSLNKLAPVHILARFGQYESFSKILGREFDIEALNNNNETPLVFKCVKQFKHV